jgi:hypothetical protein
LKMWLMPFALALTYSVRSLLRRFAGPDGVAILPAVILGPGVLPFFNLMLDIPALALQLSSVAVFLAATDERNHWLKVLAAGILAGLALQTKYSSLILPVVLVWCGVCRRAVVPAGVAVLVAAAFFANIEWLFWTKYGESHFLFHLRDASKVGLEESLRDKGALALPMLCYLGVTAGWLAIPGRAFLGDSRAGFRAAVGIAVVGGIALLVILALPGRFTALSPRLPFSQFWFDLVGVFALLAAGSAVLDRRLWNRGGLLLLAGWLAIEIAGYFVLTPFPAGRRVLGFTVVMALLWAAAWVRSASRMRWPITVGVVLGFLFAGIDIWDAHVEPMVAREAIRIGRSEPGHGYFIGHWGFQYECERNGLSPYLPRRMRLEPGDWVLVPVDPDPIGFDRPDSGGVEFDPQAEKAALIAEVWWDDWLAAETLPALYGGRCPVRSRDHPRLRVGVWRVR